jgi:hypothetical protein
VNEQVGLDLFGRAERQLHMSAVHGVAGLKRHHAAPAQACKFSPQFGRSQTQRAEVVVRRHLQAFDTASHVPGVAFIQQVIDAGMNRAGGAKYRLSFRLAVRLPNVFDVQNRQHHAFSVTQRDLAASRLERFGEIFLNVQGNGHRPQNAAAQPHVGADALVIRLGHESPQGRESSAYQQLEIADLTRRQIPRRPFPRMGLQFRDS